MDKILLLRDHMKANGLTSVEATIHASRQLPSVMTVKGDSYKGGKKPWIITLSIEDGRFQEIVDILVPGYKPGEGDVVTIALDKDSSDGEVNPDITEAKQA